MLIVKRDEYKAQGKRVAGVGFEAWLSIRSLNKVTAYRYIRCAEMVGFDSVPGTRTGALTPDAAWDLARYGTDADRKEAIERIANGEMIVAKINRPVDFADRSVYDMGHNSNGLRATFPEGHRGDKAFGRYYDLYVDASLDYRARYRMMEYARVKDACISGGDTSGGIEDGALRFLIRNDVGATKADRDEAIERAQGGELIDITKAKGSCYDYNVRMARVSS